MTKGLVFNIQKFSVHDGPGIRTAVFFKGCNLRCRWCHNPESWSFEPEIMYNKSKCVCCGECIKVCPQGAHSINIGKDGKAYHSFDRAKCIGCLKCSDICYYGALSAAGRYYTPDEVIEQVCKDRVFYEKSGGGVTFSGGEPMMQFGFLMELLQKSKENGLHVCIETAGCCNTEKLAKTMPYVDIYLYDIKETDPEKHKEYTGADRKIILENLRMLDDAGKTIIIRCPIIPGLNDREEHYINIGKLADTVKNAAEVDIEPYHPLGIAKAANLEMDTGYYNDSFMDKTAAQKAADIVAANTSKKVVLM